MGEGHCTAQLSYVSQHWSSHIHTTLWAYHNNFWKIVTNIFFILHNKHAEEKVSISQVNQFLLSNLLTQQIQNICITFVQRWTNVFDVGLTLYKYYTNVLCLLGVQDKTTRMAGFTWLMSTISMITPRHTHLVYQICSLLSDCHIHTHIPVIGTFTQII